MYAHKGARVSSLTNRYPSPRNFAPCHKETAKLYSKPFVKPNYLVDFPKKIHWILGVDFILYRHYALWRWRRGGISVQTTTGNQTVCPIAAADIVNATAQFFPTGPVYGVVQWQRQLPTISGIQIVKGNTYQPHRASPRYGVKQAQSRASQSHIVAERL